MGRKVHPIGMRLGINQGWQGRWFAEGTQYRDQLHQDFAIRSLLMGVESKGGAAKNTAVRRLRKDLPDTVKNGKAGVSPEMSIRLSKAFGSKPDVWLGLQMEYDLAEAEKHAGKIKVRRIA